MRTELLNQWAHLGFRLALFGFGEKRPLAVIDRIVEVQDVPAFGRDQWDGIVGHDGLFDYVGSDACIDDDLVR